MTTSFEALTLRRSQVGKYTISTIDDNGMIETAVYRNRNKVCMVEFHPSHTAAIQAHERWKTFCTTKPTSAYDVQYRRRLSL